MNNDNQQNQQAQHQHVPQQHTAQPQQEQQPRERVSPQLRDIDTQKKAQPVETLRDGALKVSIFRNQGQNGDYYNFVPGRIYTDDKTGQVRETRNLSGSDPLRMANLLNKSYDRVEDFKQQMKQQSQQRQRER